MHLDVLFTNSLQTGPCKSYSISVHPDDVQSVLKEQFQVSEESLLYTTSYVTYNGTTFKSDAFILMSKNEAFVKYLILKERVIVILRVYY